MPAGGASAYTPPFMPSSRRQVAPWNVCSWNVNGLRACVGKGFVPWLQAGAHDLVGLQEVRAFPHQLPEALVSLPEWHTHYTPAERPGYSGVGMLARTAPDEVGAGLAHTAFDVEGRFQWMRFGRLVVVNAYFPKGSGKDRDNSRVPYKLAFYEAALAFVQQLRRAGHHVFIMGDYNTAHTELDLARPKTNHQTSGFLPEEREAFARWVRAGWVDTFRAFNAEGGHYSWWSQRLGARARNVGWRIDYVLASPEAHAFVRRAFISADVMGSDHCPVGIEVDPRVVE